MNSFIKDFEKKVALTIKMYELLNKHDKIIVACSGGKDSTTALYVLKSLGYNIEALFINTGIPGSSDENLKNLSGFCKAEGIKLNIASLKEEFGKTLPELKTSISEKNLTNCALCGILKRSLLNKKARELGADKLVTGHNLDDEAENVLLNIFGGNLEISLGLGPKSRLESGKLFIQRIKPLYTCSNAETRKYSEIKKWSIIYCSCPFSYNAFRKQVRSLIKRLEVLEPDLKTNLVAGFNSKTELLKKDKKISGSVTRCVLCSEPSRKLLCKKCELLTSSSRIKYI